MQGAAADLHGLAQPGDVYVIDEPRVRGHELAEQLWVPVVGARAEVGAVPGEKDKD